MDWIHSILVFRLLTALAWIVIAVFVWRLFWRTRWQSPHCPRCSYDLQGSNAAACPECGCVPRSAKDTMRIRRRWKSLIVLVPALCVGWYFTFEPGLQRRINRGVQPWTAAVVPNSLHVFKWEDLPEFDRNRMVLHGERLDFAFLSEWQQRVMVKAAMRIAARQHGSDSAYNVLLEAVHDGLARRRDRSRDGPHPER